ncbi:MAG: hypothetical protein WD733_22110 [Bryobacterales bacterium]|jgi:hypothetical protein
MSTPNTETNPNLFLGLANFSEEVNRRIIQSEIEGGVHLENLPDGSALEVKTENRAYVLVIQGPGKALISGHPKFCPDPVLVSIHGSSWGGSMLKVAFIGRGMHLEFQHPEYQTITTSRILDIRTAD